MKRKINVVTLGCAKNRVDSEHLMAQLRHDRFEVVYDSDSTDAKIVVVNTCGFIGDAKQESIDTILSFAAAKNRGEIERLFVMGCLSERYKEELRPEIPASGRLLRRTGYGRRSRRGRRTMARTSRGRADADDSPALRLSENLGRLLTAGAATARSR